MRILQVGKLIEHANGNIDLQYWVLDGDLPLEEEIQKHRQELIDAAKRAGTYIFYQDEGIPEQLAGQPTEAPFMTFYLIDFKKKQNGKLFWRWTGTPVDEWKEVEDMQPFLATYYPPNWRSYIIKTMGLGGVS